jgi:hypothetical protein
MSENNPKLTKKNIESLIDTMNNFGDLIIEIGNLEKEIGTFDDFQEIFEKNIFGIISDIESRPEISDKLGKIMVRFVSLTALMKKDFNKTSPEDKVKIGIIIKEIATLMKELADKYEPK